MILRVFVVDWTRPLPRSREDAKNGRKAISKTSRSSRLRGGFFGLRLGCTVYIGVHPWFHLLFMMEIEYERE
ncbi:MAG: hypothetical protein DMG10_02975 [Acidobacteria bacterium]|nr:MAG: hypothetical protein DMG10_02975 [Acidobacteriota bacterium]